MKKIRVASGDIARVKVEALITAINSSGMWFGGIDGVIQRAAGSLFHEQARQASPLTDGQTVVARSGGAAHDGAFQNVVFVVDDLQQPLGNVVYNGLRAAADADFRSVSLPTIRMGVMLGAVESSAPEAIMRMADGAEKFLLENPDALDEVTFVVYNDPDTQRLLEKIFSAQ